jgi:hypothetical protein
VDGARSHFGWARHNTHQPASNTPADVDVCSFESVLIERTKKCSVVVMVVVMVMMAALRLHVAMMVMMMMVLRDLHIAGLFSLISRRSCTVGRTQHGKRIWDRIEQIRK